jgi:hypothetical protein
VEKTVTQGQFSAFLRQPGSYMKLVVTGGGWFIYDVAYCKCFVMCWLLLVMHRYCGTSRVVAYCMCSVIVIDGMVVAS